MTKESMPRRRCMWTGLALPENLPRVRVHPAFRRVTRGWPREQRQRYADLARQLGTLHHSQLRALAEETRQALRDAEAQRLDRRIGRVLDQALDRGAQNAER